MTFQDSLNLRKMVVPAVVMLAFWTLATVAWRSSGEIMALFFFGYIGTSVGVGLGLYAALPKKKKPLGRRLSLLMVSLFLVGFAAIYNQENMQLVGNLFYYLVGISLAYALKDNRAFCKYVCPVSVPLKITSRFALLKIGGEAEQCNDCRACVRMCPMDIRIPDYILSGDRVLSTECSLCQTCITVCAQDALKLSFGLDLGGNELLRERA